MELVNELSKAPGDPAARFAAETAVSLLQPYTPHVAEELWGVLGQTSRLWKTPWPAYDEAMLQHETIELVLQVNGKVRDRIQVPAGLPEDELISRAQRIRAGAGASDERGAARDRRAGQARQHRRLVGVRWPRPAVGRCRAVGELSLFGCTRAFPTRDVSSPAR